MKLFSTKCHLWETMRKLYRETILNPRATILLTCGRDRELWPDPIFWACAECFNSKPIRFARFGGHLWIVDFQCWTKPELLMPAAGQKDLGSGDENVVRQEIVHCYSQHVDCCCMAFVNNMIICFWPVWSICFAKFTNHSMSSPLEQWILFPLNFNVYSGNKSHCSSWVQSY